MELRFKLGIDHLLDDQIDLLSGQRVGLLAHAASLNREGDHTARLLADHPEVQLTCLFGAEHGFWSRRKAGQEVDQAFHAQLALPIFSLYGPTRKPTQEMLDQFDTLVVDLQGLAARCYTYVSTLRLVLEAAEEVGKRIVVTDRPVPLPNTVDGPMLEPAFESFVGLIPVPLQYGMTMGEVAGWIYKALDLSCDLRVVPMQGYGREERLPSSWPPWMDPSPSIRSWESALCYTATVYCEALPALDCARESQISFQILSAPWLDPNEVCKQMDTSLLRGARVEPCWHEQTACLRIFVDQPRAFRPVTTGLAILASLERCYGKERIWDRNDTRAAFFDKLFGTDTVRKHLLAQKSVCEFADLWREAAATFSRDRSKVLYYEARSVSTN